jgi:hypothetical protein
MPVRSAIVVKGGRKMSLGRRVVVVLLAGMAMTVGALLPAGQVWAQGLIQQEVEPNDTIVLANELLLPTQTVTGVTDLKDDLDFFQTTLTEGTVIRVVFSGFVADFDGRVQILNASGAILDEASRVGSASRLSLTVPISAASPPGIGYIRISNDISRPSDAKTFNYIVVVSQGVPEVEPNDNPAEAQPFNEEFPIIGEFPALTGTSEDFFSFVTTQPDESAMVSFDYPLSDTVVMGIELLDETGRVVAQAERTSISGSGANKNPSMVAPLPNAGQYSVRVFNAGGLAPAGVVINYSIFFERRLGVFEVEPNQSFREAVAVSVPAGSEGVTVGGFLQVAQDVDLYRVGVPAGFMLVADVDSTSDLPVLDGVVSTFLEEDQGIAFASNDDSSQLPAGASFSLVNLDPYVRVLPRREGTVYVGVADRGNRGSAIGFEYNLHLRLQALPTSEGEPNNTAGAETRLQPGEIARGTIGVSGDVDRFVIEANGGETLLVNLNAFGIGSFLDARVILTDPLGAVLRDDSSSSFGPDPFILISPLEEDGDYTIAVQARQGAAGSGASYYYELSAVRSATMMQEIISNPDINRSSRVDGFDLADLSRRFGSVLGQPAFDQSADLFPDNSIDGSDLAVLGNFFGADLPFPGLSELIADTVDDATPFFGPSSEVNDLAGIAASRSGSLLDLSFFYANTVDENTGGVLSLDIDASSLTGSVGTPDAYTASRSLGSEVEIFLDSEGLQVFAIPDPRTDILAAFVANVGDVTAADFPLSVDQRRVPQPTRLVPEASTTPLGNSISFQIDSSVLGGNTNPSAAALALSVKDVEPTDRLPNQGKVRLRPPFEFSSVVVMQKVCDDDHTVLCSGDADCTGSCVDVDAAPPDAAEGSSALPSRDAVYLRTEDGGPKYTVKERGVSRTLIGTIDNGSTYWNDTLDRVFPFGTRPLAGNQSPFRWFTRDMLFNLAYRDASFDPHGGTLPPPDVDLYYFYGGEEDQTIIEVTTADQGQTFDSAIELFSIPLDPSALDPSTPEALQAVTAQDLTFIAAADDKSPTDLDPRLEVTLSTTSLYVVRVTASAKFSPCCPAVHVPYLIYLESLRPDEFSLPVVVRAPNLPGSNRAAGLSFYLQYDPEVVQITGVDLGRGMRVFSNSIGLSLSTAQELVAQAVSGVSGLTRFAILSFRSNEFSQVNGLRSSDPTPLSEGQPRCSGFTCPELPVARLRFRAVGPGSTTIEFVPNPTTPGEPLNNLGVQQNFNGPIWQPFWGYGPGVSVTVTGTTP